LSRLISYARNGEDVVLHRALKDEPSVTYVDVGAGHPVVASLSKSLHALGWRGIHVEPVPSYAEGLREQRPHDVVIEGCAGADDATVPFWFAPESGMSTSSATQAEEARQRGWVVNESSVRVRPLAAILDEHLDGRPLHVLRVDVPGDGSEVLTGADLARHRPWVVVVGASRPRAAEALLTEAGYVPALFDGVNQWYLSSAHLELAEALSYPACPLDPWTRVGLDLPDPPSGDAAHVLSAAALRLAAARTDQRAAESVASELQTENRALRADAQRQEKRITELERLAARHLATTQAMERSTSWRLTKPVRRLGALGKGRGSARA